jgi:hypothetical protein
MARAALALPAGQPVVLLKGQAVGAINLQEANINLNAVLYKRAVLPHGTGLSSGAVAGIVVGSCAGAALLVAAGAMFLRQRQRRLRAEQASMAKVGLRTAYV